MPDRCPKCGSEIVYVEMESGHRVPVDKFTIDERVIIVENGKSFRNKCGISHHKTCQKKQRWRMT